MSPTSDTAEATAPRDPAAYRPRRRLAWTFLGAGLFGLVCLLGGIGLAKLWPKVLGHRPVTVQETLDTPVIRRPLRRLPAPAPRPVTSTSDPSPDADLQRLDSRVAVLESQAQRTSRAAAAALGAAAVAEASQGSRPFSNELAALRSLSAFSPEITALTELAETGAPSRAALAQSFPQYAARAAAAARTPGEGAGLGQRILFAISRIVTLRRVGDLTGPGPDAVLARAEQQVGDGELDRALETLDGLPVASREALEPWMVRAARRADIDRAASALRARALQDLGASRPGP